MGLEFGLVVGLRLGESGWVRGARERERAREFEVASLYLLRLRLRGGLGNGLISGVENWVGTRRMRSHTRIRVERIGCVTMTNYYRRVFKAFSLYFV